VKPIKTSEWRNEKLNIGDARYFILCAPVTEDNEIYDTKIYCMSSKFIIG
jgi:hypothetical protein